MIEAPARAYSVLRHLGSALWLNHDPRQGCFMIYTGYYDASSKEEVLAIPLVVAGIAASEDKWIQFHSEWKQVLAEHSVVFLDMAACAQWQGVPYEAWERNEKIRISFLSKLIEALTKAATQAVVVRILPADFNAVNAVYRLGTEFWPSAYPMAALKCMGLMESILAPDNKAYRMAHVVESGDTGQGALAVLQHKGWPIAVQPKHNPHTGQWFHPFGACDLVAYEYRKAIQKKLEKGTGRIPFRGALRALQGIPTKAVYIDQAGLTAMCEAEPDTYPRRNQ